MHIERRIHKAADKLKKLFVIPGFLNELLEHEPRETASLRPHPQHHPTTRQRGQKGEDSYQVPLPPHIHVQIYGTHECRRLTFTTAPKFTNIPAPFSLCQGILLR